MSVFAVPKERQNVTMHIRNEEKVEGVIFLESFPEGRSWHQKIFDFLEAGNRFFPFLVKESGVTELLNKSTLMILEFEYPDEETLEASFLNPIHIDGVTLVFNDIDRISGSILAEVPQEQSRLSDCLNLANHFLCLKVGNRLYYVNKNIISKVLIAQRPRA